MMKFLKIFTLPREVVSEFEIFRGLHTKNNWRGFCSRDKGQPVEEQTREIKKDYESKYRVPNYSLIISLVALLVAAFK